MILFLHAFPFCVAIPTPHSSSHITFTLHSVQSHMYLTFSSSTCLSHTVTHIYYQVSCSTFTVCIWFCSSSPLKYFYCVFHSLTTFHYSNVSKFDIPHTWGFPTCIFLLIIPCIILEFYWFKVLATKFIQQMSTRLYFKVSSWFRNANAHSPTNNLWQLWWHQICTNQPCMISTIYFVFQQKRLFLYIYLTCHSCRLKFASKKAI